MNPIAEGTVSLPPSPPTRSRNTLRLRRSPPPSFCPLRVELELHVGETSERDLHLRFERFRIIKWFLSLD